MSEKKDDDRRLLAIILLWAVILTIIFCAMSSCKTTHQPTPPPPETHYIHDTIKTVEHRDSIVYVEKAVRDSSSFRKDGDTVTIEHWHWERDRKYEKILEAKIDSFSHAKRDSIPYAVPGPTQYVNELKKWQRTLMWIGVIDSILIICFLYIRIRTRRFRVRQ